ncbi:MAG: hypothetical protein AAF393_13040 [Pseudomonadota bacterium]
MTKRGGASAGADETDTEDRLVLVVHGIGEQMPGETVDLLVGGLTGDRPCHVEPQTRHLHEMKTRWSKSGDADLFPCDIRSVKDGNRRTDFAEVYWGDLSRGFDGRLRGIIALFTLIMSLGHIIRENRNEKNTQSLRSLLARGFVSMLHGPIIAINIALGASLLSLVFVNAVSSVLAREHVDFEGIIPDITLLVAASGLMAFWFFNRHDRSSHLYNSFLNGLLIMACCMFALVAITALSAAYMSLGMLEAILGRITPAMDTKVWACLSVDGFANARCRLLWYTETLVLANALCWAVTIVMVLLLGINQALVDLFSKDASFKRTLYPATCALVMVIWLFMALIVWAGITEFFARFQPSFDASPTIQVASQPDSGESPAPTGGVELGKSSEVGPTGRADIQNNATIRTSTGTGTDTSSRGNAGGNSSVSGGREPQGRSASVELQESVVGLLTLPKFVLAKSTLEAKSVAAAISLATFLLVLACTLVGVHRIAALQWHKWRQKGDTIDYAPPRLIISTSLRFALTACVFLLFMVVLFEIAPFLSPEEESWLQAVQVSLISAQDFLKDSIYGFALMLVAGAGLVFSFARSYISVGFGIANDVVVWFVKSEDSAEPDEDLYPMRQRILNRFDLVYTSMLKAAEARDKPYSEVVVIAHSQGTLVAFQALRKGRLAEKLREPGMPKYLAPDLVTMGSPISHLYNHYFSESFWIDILDPTGIKDWTNIYRTDDFVGTEVTSKQVKDWPMNKPIPAGGHTNYWTDAAALELLRTHATPEFPLLPAP